MKDVWEPGAGASALIILLTRAGLLNLLQLVSQEIVVPAAVAMEIQQYGVKDVTAQAIAQTNWLFVVETLPVPELIQSWDLGAGESAALTWSGNFGCTYLKKYLKTLFQCF